MSVSPMVLHEAKPGEAISLGKAWWTLETAQVLLDLHSLYGLFSHTVLGTLLAVLSVTVPVHSRDRADQSRKPHLFLNMSP